jgi:hypothetical protein
VWAKCAADAERRAFMRKDWYEVHYLLEGVILTVAALNGGLAYKFFPAHPIMAFLHAVMAVAMVLAVVFAWKLDRPS